MNLQSVKDFLRPYYYQYFSGIAAERSKTSLRKKISSLPLSTQYPYDVEAKLLRHAGLELSPMFDIGANTGFYSAVLEDLIGSKNLYLFEPLPFLITHLTNHFKNANVFHLALSNTEGFATLKVPFIEGRMYDTRATLNTHEEQNQTGTQDIQVNLSTLDKIVQDHKLPSLGLLKIDVEGHELSVLEGATDTLTKFKPLIFIEIESRHHHNSIQSVFYKFEILGFKGFYVNPTTLELLPIDNFDEERDQNLKNLERQNVNKYLNNFFFVHESKAEDFTDKVMHFLKNEREFAARH